MQTGPAVQRGTPAFQRWISPEDAARALESGDGTGVRIAVLDSGIEVDHPELGGITLADDVCITTAEDGSLAAEDGDGTDLFGHGTAVASIVRQIAPGATIGSFRVLGGGLTSRTAIISAGVRHALARGYHILNCSFGCRGDARFVLPFKSWVDEAFLRGHHVVAACSNAGAALPEWPAHFTSVIAVDFRDCAPEQIFFEPDAMVAFAARGCGVDVPWLGGRGKKQTGSSYAAPHVAGMLARLLSVYPEISPALARELLARAAEANSH